MINPNTLKPSDVGRQVVYRSGERFAEQGQLTSWNPSFVFVRFRGPDGEACRPEDVEFLVFSEREK